ncbi:MAG TPA: hypothetical protein VL495_00425 [Edaphobacter sp.]|nr:hypothetical protein [Edaphobacter sp.]
MILSVIRKISLCALLIAFCYVPTSFGQALTHDGFVTTVPQGSTFLLLGQSMALTATQVGCSGSDAGRATMNFYASPTPNTQGTFIGSYPMNTIGFVWFPPAVGDYYVSSYLMLNGATSCTGVELTGPFTGGTVRVEPNNS